MLSAAYLRDLLIALERRVRDEQSDPDGRVRLEVHDTDLVLVMEAAGRQLVHPLDDPVYHYEPDGLDAEKHASWLTELFIEEAR